MVIKVCPKCGEPMSVGQAAPRLHKPAVRNSKGCVMSNAIAGCSKCGQHFVAEPPCYLWKSA